MNATQTTTSGAQPQKPAQNSDSLGRPVCEPDFEPRNAESPLSRRNGPPESATLSFSAGANPGAGLLSPRLGRKPNWVWVAGGAVLAALTLYLGARYAAYARSWVRTDNAYLAAHIHSISSRVPGTVQEVLVQENQDVAAGEVLARLDSRDFEVRRQQALAQVAQAGAQVEEAAARIAQARALVAREQARATKAKNDQARANSLYGQGSGAISKQEFDLAEADAQAAEAALQGAQSGLASANASAAAAQAAEQAAKANLQEAQLQLSYTEIVAPAAGRVGKKNLESGNRVQPGQALLALVQPEVWVTANFKETQLARLRPGQTVNVRVDAFPGRVLKGTVQDLSPGSGAQFALLPPENATGNFTRIVQRVPVRIALDRESLGDLASRLIAGMSAEVEVKVND